MTRRLMLLLALGSLSVSADSFNTDAYKPTSLANAVAEFDEREKDAKLDYMIETANIKYAVVGVYTGQHRELTGSERELVHHWAQSLRHSEALFAQDVEIQSGEKKYWLPIQDSLYPALASEIGPGGSVKLYIMLLGGTRSGAVLAISGFEGQ